MLEEDRRSGPREASTTEGLPIAPSLAPTLDAMHAPLRVTAIDRRVLVLSALSIAVAFAAGLVARVLTALIGLITNLAFYGRFDTSFTSPAGNHLGPFVVAVPVAGAIIVGFMARYGSERIRGHGIPEAIEAILINGSRIQPRVAILKPISAAISIGSGGPFGAEGPIIMTGGAFGSMIAQFFHLTNAERKTLLVAGAAAVPKEARLNIPLAYGLNQGYPVIAALWGLLVWKEFKDSGPKTKVGTMLMLILYIGGLALLSLAPLYVRKG